MSALTQREREILHHVAAGATNDQIARRLNLTTDTVKSHMRHITIKLRATNRTHAVVLAIKYKAITTRHVHPAPPYTVRRQETP